MVFCVFSQTKDMSDEKPQIHSVEKSTLKFVSLNPSTVEVSPTQEDPMLGLTGLRGVPIMTASQTLQASSSGHC